MSSPDPFTSADKAFDSTAKTISGTIIAIILVFVLVPVVVVIVICCYRRRIGKSLESASKLAMQALPRAQPSHTTPPPLLQVDSPTIEKFLLEISLENPICFTSQQLRAFTDDYKTLLGSGGFGKVYKGQLSNQVKIAVKVLNQGGGGTEDKAIIEQQFMAEVGSIGRTHHINLVRLYGFCYDQYTSALVYEYLENGSLDRFLFDEKKKQELEWGKLHEIAIGTAKGISYLHEECQKRIVHYDIKPENILLDSNFSPKVADFGLAKLCNRDATHVTLTAIKGTRGYMAPELLMLIDFPITYKCDVYSFGILLFEIVGRRRNVRSGGENCNLNWFPRNVWEEYEKGELAQLVEACGIEEKVRDKAKKMAMVALWCVQDSPETRPPMSAVVKMLEGGVEVMPPPKPFRYLFSSGANVLRPLSLGWSRSDFTESEETGSYWYKDTTPMIKAKYEIEIATSLI